MTQALGALLAATLVPTILFYFIGVSIVQSIRLAELTIGVGFALAWLLAGISALVIADEPNVASASNTVVASSLIGAILSVSIISVAGRRKTPIARDSSGDRDGSIGGSRSPEKSMDGQPTSASAQTAGLTRFTQRDWGVIIILVGIAVLVFSLLFSSGSHPKRDLVGNLSMMEVVVVEGEYISKSPYSGHYEGRVALPVKYPLLVGVLFLLVGIGMLSISRGAQAKGVNGQAANSE